jgi:hypothetical protein
LPIRNANLIKTMAIAISVGARKRRSTKPLELKRQVQAGEPRSVIGRTVEKIEGLLGATGANLMYAGYPYDSFAPDAPKS